MLGTSRIRSAGFRILHLEAEHVHGMNDLVSRCSGNGGNSGMLVLPSQGRLGTQQPASHHSQKTSRLVNGRCKIVYYSRSFLWIGARKSYPQFHLPHHLLASGHVAALLHPQRAWAAGCSSQTLAYHDHDRQRDVTV